MLGQEVERVTHDAAARVAARAVVDDERLQGFHEAAMQVARAGRLRRGVDEGF